MDLLDSICILLLWVSTAGRVGERGGGGGLMRTTYTRRTNLWVHEYRFSRPFSSPLHSILNNVFSILSRTLWNVRMLISISSLVDQFRNIVIQYRALSPVFVNCNSNSSVTVAEHETAKSISSIGIHFRQSFNQIRLPDLSYT